MSKEDYRKAEHMLSRLDRYENRELRPEARGWVAKLHLEHLGKLPDCDNGEGVRA